MQEKNLCAIMREYAFFNAFFTFQLFFFKIMLFLFSVAPKQTQLAICAACSRVKLG